MAKPPRARGPRRQKNERSPPSPAGRWEQRSGLRLAESRLGQRERERERERRASDADASYYAPTRSARTPKHVIPKRNHAKNNSLSKNDPVPLPRALLKPVSVSPQSPTPTRPYVVLHPIGVLMPHRGVTYKPAR